MTTREISLINGVTAFVGEQLEPSLVDIHIQGGRIERIEGAPPSQNAGQDVQDQQTIDGSGMLAIPGMVDCHDHLRDLTPGLPLSEGLKLDDFLRAMWETQRGMGTAEYRVAALLGNLQRLKTGITTVCDHCYTFHAPGLDDASLDGNESSGVRWVYARGIMTRPYEPVCEPWSDAEEKIRGLVESGRVSADALFVAPVSIRQATPEEFKKARALADELGGGLYTHVSETSSEREVWQAECGTTPIKALDQLDFLGPSTVLVHCVILDDEEIDILAQRGCHVVHCPTNNMKLAKGITRVPDLLKAGVNVALGIDMMSDMFTEMRIEIGMQAIERSDPNAVSKDEASRMATVRGARALGMEETTGAISVGRQADIALLEGRSLLQAVMMDPVHALIYATHPGMVRHVIVGGRQVIADGQSTQVDEGALVEEAESIASSFLERAGISDRPWFVRNGRQVG